LLNNLTDSSVVVENALFATLNPVSRRLRFPKEREIIVTDTVGFIRNLPHELMEAFQTTFEELHDADLLLHVLDANGSDVEGQYETVRRLLAQLELERKPVVAVLNKIDLCDDDTIAGLVRRYDAIPLSALNRDTFGLLIKVMEQLLWTEDRANEGCDVHGALAGPS
ncbi:MAG TPA: GTPase HflX, partial [Candidatus Hydrogenedentes bacterium]|nr:GTPase HflX [Candidatus Hydrogenedentota bacterium]